MGEDLPSSESRIPCMLIQRHKSLQGWFCPSRGGDKAAAEETATRPRFYAGIAHLQSPQRSQRRSGLAGAVTVLPGLCPLQPGLRSTQENRILCLHGSASDFVFSRVSVRFKGPTALVLLKLVDLSILSCAWVFLRVIVRGGTKSEKN